MGVHEQVWHGSKSTPKDSHDRARSGRSKTPPLFDSNLGNQAATIGDRRGVPGKLGTSGGRRITPVLRSRNADPNFNMTIVSTGLALEERRDSESEKQIGKDAKRWAEQRPERIFRGRIYVDEGEGGLGEEEARRVKAISEAYEEEVRMWEAVLAARDDMPVPASTEKVTGESGADAPSDPGPETAHGGTGVPRVRYDRDDRAAARALADAEESRNTVRNMELNLLVDRLQRNRSYQADRRLIAFMDDGDREQLDSSGEGAGGDVRRVGTRRFFVSPTPEDSEIGFDDEGQDEGDGHVGRCNTSAMSDGARVELPIHEVSPWPWTVKDGRLLTDIAMGRGQDRDSGPEPAQLPWDPLQLEEAARDEWITHVHRRSLGKQQIYRKREASNYVTQSIRQHAHRKIDAFEAARTRDNRKATHEEQRAKSGKNETKYGRVVSEYWDVGRQQVEREHAERVAELLGTAVTGIETPPRKDRKMKGTDEGGYDSRGKKEDGRANLTYVDAETVAFDHLRRKEIAEQSHTTAGSMHKAPIVADLYGEPLKGSRDLVVTSAFGKLGRREHAHVNANELASAVLANTSHHVSRQATIQASNVRDGYTKIHPDSARTPIASKRPLSAGKMHEVVVDEQRQENACRGSS